MAPSSKTRAQKLQDLKNFVKDNIQALAERNGESILAILKQNVETEPPVQVQQQRVLDDGRGRSIEWYVRGGQDSET